MEILTLQKDIFTKSCHIKFQLELHLESILSNDWNCRQWRRCEKFECKIAKSNDTTFLALFDCKFNIAYWLVICFWSAFYENLQNGLIWIGFELLSKIILLQLSKTQPFTCMTHKRCPMPHSRNPLAFHTSHSMVRWKKKCKTGYFPGQNLLWKKVLIGFALNHKQGVIRLNSELKVQSLEGLF